MVSAMDRSTASQPPASEPSRADATKIGRSEDPNAPSWGR